ncbi:MAG: TonB family protein [Candidatus Acidiferrales bacterium]
MTPTKDALETGNSSAENDLLQTKNRPKPESPHLRSDAVSLEIPVKVHGSLVPNLAPGVAPQAQPFEEQTTTMIVFPQGSVLKMSTSVSAGQVMVLTNMKSRQDAICRVIKVRAYGKTQSYVEVEFTSPQPAYWGVYFPTDGPEVARMAPPEPVAAAAPGVAEPAAPPAPPAPAAETRAPEPIAPAPPVISPAAMQVQPAALGEAPKPAIPPSIARPKLPESSFASIGTKEDFLPSASVTKVPRASSFVSSTKPPATADTDISDAIDALIAPSGSAARSSSKLDLHDREVPVAPSAGNSAADRHGSPATSPDSLSEQEIPAPKQMFGVTLDSASSAAVKPSQRSGGKAIAFIGVAALVAVAAGGAYYYSHMRSASRPAASPAVVSASVSHPAVAQNSVASSETSNVGAATRQIPDQSGAAAQTAAIAPSNDAARTRPPDLRASEPRAKMRESGPLDERRERTPSIASGVQSASAPSQPAVAIPSTFGALNTRPVINAQSGENSVGAAPALEPGGSPAPVESALSSIAPPPPKLAAPPKPVFSAPVRVGGKVLPPRLISSVLPTYPSLAQQAGVTGTVVIDTTVDKEGRVAKMKVVSGPVLLRGAALSALRQWKYTPSRLNGQPISVKMIVSIRFHR